MNIKKTLILSLFLTIKIFCQSNIADNSGTSEEIMSSKNIRQNIIELDSASLFYTSGKPIHAVTFDKNGLMFLGGKLDVFTLNADKSINHFITLQDPCQNTIIWSMIFDKNGNLFIAANDRIVKVTPDKKQYAIIKESFSGPCGVTDLRFDKIGNLYAIYDKIVARYDSLFNKVVFVDGSKFKIPIQWGVGIEFSNDEQYLFIGDCWGSKVYIVQLTGNNLYENTKTIKTNFGQYFAKDNSGNIYLTSIGGEDGIPELKMFKENHSSIDIICRNKPIQNENSYKKTIAYREDESGRKAVYCIIGDKIYSYPVNP